MDQVHFLVIKIVKKYFQTWLLFGRPGSAKSESVKNNDRKIKTVSHYLFLVKNTAGNFKRLKVGLSARARINES